MAGDDLVELIRSVTGTRFGSLHDSSAIAAALRANPDVVLNALGGVKAMPGAPAYDDVVVTWLFPKE